MVKFRMDHQTTKRQLVNWIFCVLLVFSTQVFGQTLDPTGTPSTSDAMTTDAERLSIALSNENVTTSNKNPTNSSMSTEPVTILIPILEQVSPFIGNQGISQQPNTQQGRETTRSQPDVTTLKETAGGVTLSTEATSPSQTVTTSLKDTTTDNTYTQTADNTSTEATVEVVQTTEDDNARDATTSESINKTDEYETTPEQINSKTKNSTPQPNNSSSVETANKQDPEKTQSPTRLPDEHTSTKDPFGDNGPWFLPTSSKRPTDVDTGRLSVSVETYTSNEDAFWQVAVALTIGVPSIIVFAVTITVLYKRRMTKGRSFRGTYDPGFNAV